MSIGKGIRKSTVSNTRISRIAPRLFVLGALSSILLASSFIPLHLVFAANQQVDANSLRVGELVAQGQVVKVSNGTSCYFANVQTFFTKVIQGRSESIDLQQNSNCGLIVASIESSSSNGQGVGPQISGDPTNNYVYNHDPVGLVLTSVKGTATVSTCGSNICISQYVETCTIFPDGWVNTNCTPDTVNFVGNPAFGSGHGDFHWLMNSYQHTLYNSENIYNQGGSIVLVCSWSWSGSIVQGLGAGIGEQCYFS